MESVDSDGATTTKEPEMVVFRFVLQITRPIGQFTFLNTHYHEDGEKNLESTYSDVSGTKTRVTRAIFHIALTSSLAPITIATRREMSRHKTPGFLLADGNATNSPSFNLSPAQFRHCLCPLRLAASLHFDIFLQANASAPEP